MKNFDLDKNKQQPPFGIPENYFEAFAGNVEDRIKGEQVPKKANKKLPFGLPENYFELLPQYIAKRIEALLPKRWYKQPTFQWAVATCSVVLVCTVAWFNFPDSNKSNIHLADKELAESLKTIPKEELIQYLAYHQPEESLVQAQVMGIPQEVYTLKDKPTHDSALHKIPKNISTEELLENDLDRKELEKILEEELDEEDLEEILNP